MKRYLSKVASIVALLSLAVSAFGVLPASASVAFDYVDVSATVNQALAFDIVQWDNATNTAVTTCPLGTLSMTAVNNCRYALRISSNASNGYFAGYRGATEFINASGTWLTHVTDGTVTTGTEEYGLRIVASTDGGYVGVGDYSNPSAVVAPYTTDQQINITTSTPVTRYVGAPFDNRKGTTFYNNSALTQVIHSASISLGTPSGVYSQRVWWEVTTSP